MPAPHKSPLRDYTTDNRVLVITLLAAIIGGLAVCAARVLVWLIGFFTNLFYYQRLDTSLVSPGGAHLTLWSVLIPVIGGLIVELMARYGSEKIRGHGIP